MNKQVVGIIVLIIIVAIAVGIVRFLKRSETPGAGIETPISQKETDKEVAKKPSLTKSDFQLEMPPFEQEASLDLEGGSIFKGVVAY